MELENMKAVWFEMSEKLAQQQKVTDRLILQMAHEKSSSRLQRIILMEGMGMVLAAIMTVLLLFHFHRLNNWLNMTGGVGTILIFLVSIAFGIRIIRKARKIDLAQNSYRQTLEDFADLRKTLGFYKKVSIWLNVVMPFFLLPVVFQLLLGKDLLADFPAFGKALLICALLAPPLLYLFIKYYGSIIAQIRKVFEEVDGGQ